MGKILDVKLFLVSNRAFSTYIYEKGRIWAEFGQNMGKLLDLKLF
jgi:hypothetical protein